MRLHDGLCKTPDQVDSPSQFGMLIVILLRFGQTRNDVSKLNRNLISYPAASVARLVNGIPVSNRCDSS